MTIENTTTSCPNLDETVKRLSAYFEASEVKWKPQAISGNRALAIAFVDARVIQDRLDEVLGVDNWQDDYEPLPDGSVLCRLKLRLGDEWIIKVDVGGISEQPDAGDRMKAAFSDALKRTAVKFGIGRYLYRLPSQWVDYDAQKRQFVKTPQLPAWALPGGKPAVAERVAPAAGPVKTPARPSPAQQVWRGERPPADGAELEACLQAWDRGLEKELGTEPHTLFKYVLDQGVNAGLPTEIVRWTGAALVEAVKVAKCYAEDLRAAAKRTD